MNNSSFFIGVVYLLIIYGCNFCTKYEHLNTKKLDGRDLYVQIFEKKCGGVYGGDYLSYYVTDSLNYKKFIGSCDAQYYYITAKVEGDHLVAQKYSRSDRKLITIDRFDLPE